MAAIAPAGRANRKEDMPRSVRKGPFVDNHLAKKVAEAASKNDRRPIKTWSRRSMVLPDMVGGNVEGEVTVLGAPLIVDLEV